MKGSTPTWEDSMSHTSPEKDWVKKKGEKDSPHATLYSWGVTSNTFIKEMPTTVYKQSSRRLRPLLYLFLPRRLISLAHRGGQTQIFSVIYTSKA